MTTRRKAPKAVKPKKSAAVKFLEKLAGGPLTFAQLLRSSRENAELTQAELGRRVGASRAYICDLEKGRKPLSPKKAAEIARAMDHGDTLFVSLALQDQVTRAGLKLTVKIEAA